jgi:hypothetical protein
MATFYLLPPRPFLGQRFAGYLNSMFGGLEWSSRSWIDLAEKLGAAVEEHPNVYVVYREDLPEGEDTAEALTAGFGAETGDEVIEVQLAGRLGEMTSRRWLV